MVALPVVLVAVGAYAFRGPAFRVDGKEAAFRWRGAAQAPQPAALRRGVPPAPQDSRSAFPVGLQVIALLAVGGAAGRRSPVLPRAPALRRGGAGRCRGSPAPQFKFPIPTVTWDFQIE